MNDLVLVAGARPNFMKIASVIRAIESSGDGRLTYKLVHTGQHYDRALSQSFFTDLGLPEPDINLEVGSGTHAEQTAQIMVRFEQYLMANPCQYVLVVGDVNSTLACSVAAKKLHIGVIHVEAGLRSGDVRMPEEINRMVTDAVTDLFFTTTEQASANLRREGHADDKIFLVGNTMIDTLITNEDRFQAPALFDELSLKKNEFLVMTLHRPSNVDDPDQLESFLNQVVSANPGYPIVFPVHPRTAGTLNSKHYTNIHTVSPMRYPEFMYLVQHSMGVITDSGGIQEETTYFGVPCLTLRETTERPETIDLGTNVLVDPRSEELPQYLADLFNRRWKSGEIPAFWDGMAGERIVRVIQQQ